ncbi:MAG: hypothetical protein ABSF65_05350 [Candidatus Bathyarchaeia archaeon]
MKNKMPTYNLVGKLEWSRTKHSLKVWMLDPNGKWVFLGLVTPRALEMLLRSKISQADIVQFQAPTQEPLEVQP